MNGKEKKFENMKLIPLEEQKDVVFNILCHFDDFCRLNDIDYVLAFGTCLGAVRHGGFIPWDDDIDVAMTRKNYEKLLELWQDSENYMLLCNERYGKKYDSPLPKVIDKRTILHQVNRTEKFDIGLYIDIFVLDYILPEDVEEAVIKANKLSRKYLLATTKYKFNGLRAWYYNIKKFFCKVLSGRVYTKLIQRLIREKTIEYSDTVAVINFILYEKWWPSEIFEKTIDFEFNGRKFKVPSEYDSYLRITYGDYKMLPPQEKRVSNHTFEAYWI